MAGFTSLWRLHFFNVSLLVFILVSVAMTIIGDQLPKSLYSYKRWMFRERRWEHGGRVYERLFGVKYWKSKLPDISDFMKWRFNKKHLAELDNHYLDVFLIESCKAEFTHWMIILSSVLSLLWDSIVSALLIFLLSVILNLPYIIIQRYNRPRLIRLLKRNHSAGNVEWSAAKV